VKPSAATIGLALVGVAVLLLIAVLLMGGPERSAERAAPASANMSQAPLPAAGSGMSQPAPAVVLPTEPEEAGPGTWVGDYGGRFEGNDAEGTLRIAMGSNRLLQVRLDIGAPGCAGQVEFRNGSPQGDLLALTGPTEDYDRQCKLILTRRGDRIDLSEENCTSSHGFECSFNGSVSRTAD
jgi:hypothetical protein